MFNWLWPKIVQHAVDEFIQYWNDHKTRKQKSSNLPSGTSPNLIFDFPENYGLINCGTRLAAPKEEVEALRATIPKSREKCFRWVSDDFKIAAETAYAQIGSPRIVHTSGWQIFVDMLALL